MQAVSYTHLDVYKRQTAPAEIAATFAILSLLSTLLLMPATASTATSVAFFIPLRSTIGFAPAARLSLIHISFLLRPLNAASSVLLKMHSLSLILEVHLPVLLHAQRLYQRKFLLMVYFA